MFQLKHADSHIVEGEGPVQGSFFDQAFHPNFAFLFLAEQGRREDLVDQPGPCGPGEEGVWIVATQEPEEAHSQSNIKHFKARGLEVDVRYL